MNLKLDRRSGHPSCVHLHYQAAPHVSNATLTLHQQEF
jgi:hypothetical protein